MSLFIITAYLESGEFIIVSCGISDGIHISNTAFDAWLKLLFYIAFYECFRQLSEKKLNLPIAVQRVVCFQLPMFVFLLNKSLFNVFNIMYIFTRNLGVYIPYIARILRTRKSVWLSAYKPSLICDSHPLCPSTSKDFRFMADMFIMKMLIYLQVKFDAKHDLFLLQIFIATMETQSIGIMMISTY